MARRKAPSGQGTFSFGPPGAPPPEPPADPKMPRVVKGPLRKLKAEAPPASKPAIAKPESADPEAAAPLSTSPSEPAAASRIELPPEPDKPLFDLLTTGQELLWIREEVQHGQPATVLSWWPVPASLTLSATLARLPINAVGYRVGDQDWQSMDGAYWCRESLTWKPRVPADV